MGKVRRLKAKGSRQKGLETGASMLEVGGRKDRRLEGDKIKLGIMD